MWSPYFFGASLAATELRLWSWRSTSVGICASKAAFCATGRARTAADTNAVHDRFLQSMRVRFSDSEQWCSPRFGSPSGHGDRYICKWSFAGQGGNHDDPGPSGIRHVGGAKLSQALVRNVRTYTAMPREKAQATTTARPKVPMRRLWADCSVVASKRVEYSWSLRARVIAIGSGQPATGR